VQKLTGEYYCQIFHSLYGIEAVALRYFNVFGPRQDPNSQYAAVIPKFITLFLGGASPVIDGDGGQARDFTYIDNVVHANLLACEASSAVAARSSTPPAGTNQREAPSPRSSRRCSTRRADSVRAAAARRRPHSLADLGKARRLLGYDPCALPGRMEKAIDLVSQSARRRNREGRLIRVSIIGMGYVGVPLAIEFANGGLDVIGIDTDPTRSADSTPASPTSWMSRRGPERDVWTRRPPRHDRLRCPQECDAVCICVPRPAQEPGPDISYIVAAVDEVRKYLHKACSSSRKHDLSGTTED